MKDTVVHLVRHGQVENPEGILYGRLPGFGLSKLGNQMADRLGEYFAGTAMTHLRCSPLQRAQETIRPIADRHPELEVVIDERVIEAPNEFEGMKFGASNSPLRNPKMFWHMRNPLRPSWGEDYISIANRMKAALLDAAAEAGEGGVGLILSHQLPIWMLRSHVEGRRLAHDPRKRECRLASVTSFQLRGDQILGVEYTEPCVDLLPKSNGRKFRVGT